MQHSYMLVAYWVTPEQIHHAHHHKQEKEKNKDKTTTAAEGKPERLLTRDGTFPPTTPEMKGVLPPSPRPSGMGAEGGGAVPNGKPVCDGEVCVLPPSVARTPSNPPELKLTASA